MKWLILSLAVLVPAVIFALVPDHAHAQIYVGSCYLLVSYWLIPRRPYVGWVASFTGNAMYLYPVAQLHRIDLMIVPTAFTVLSIWNAVRELNKTTKS